MSPGSWASASACRADNTGTGLAMLLIFALAILIVTAQWRCERWWARGGCWASRSRCMSE